MHTFSFISLGCAKNRVDAETVIGELIHRGLQLVPLEEDALLVIINTCAFLQEARQEALDTVKQCIKAKKSGQRRLQHVVVMGCLAQYVKGFGLESGVLKEVDATVSLDEAHEMPERIGSLLGLPWKGNTSNPAGPSYRRFLTTAPYSVNIKITEGCENFCSYCLIPALRGPLKSKAVEEVVAEVQAVEKLGAREINLIGQDISLFGADRYGKPALLQLLQRLVTSISSVSWVRLLYVHPARVDRRLVDFMAREPLLCKYLDLPIQHVNTRLLNLMGRRTTREDLIKVYELLRAGVPNIALRTTVMTGYPGESEAAFQELLEFLRAYPFERLGSFAYSPETGTRAYASPGRVRPEIAAARQHMVMEQQKTISREQNRSLLGTRTPALVESYDPGKRKAYGRIYAQAPEVDGKIIIPGPRSLRPGKLVPVRITGVGSYDFMGERL